ncbi:MAG: T9SS type A sorting domain-containing protein [Vicingaceae bacterium]
MMLSRTLFICSFFALVQFAFGQDGVLPYNRSGLEPLDRAHYISAPAPDIDKLVAEDLETDQDKNIPYRFGAAILVNKVFEEVALKSKLEQGGYVRRLGITSASALSLNLLFDRFKLAKGVQLSIRDSKGRLLLGYFTAKEHQSDGRFSTYIVRNDSLIIEVFYPNEYVKSEVVLSHVIHGYRSFGSENASAENFGSSGSCNINVSCSEGQAWQRQKQSVVMILAANNSRICSGAMINSVKEDGRPFLLTANHCPVSTNNLFVFNYESPVCYPSVDSNSLHTISGASILARNAKSDFLLMELNSSPPAPYNVFFSGWNSTGETPEFNTGIHHPRGDVKKISLDLDNAESSGYYFQGDDHWKVVNWEKGTTENASSGSPLYDHNKRIIGQLHGGEASCNNTEGEDYYGKLSVSWQENNDSLRQLKYWLDPDNTGASLLSGRWKNEIPGDYDAALLGFIQLPNTNCGSGSFTPKILVKNRGNNAIDSIYVDVYINNVFLQRIVYQNSIQKQEIVSLSGQPASLGNGFFKLKAEVSIPGKTDTKMSNNSIDQGFTNIANPQLVSVIVKTDDYGDEFSWELRSQTGTILHSKGDYPTKPGGELFNDSFCLPEGCFTFEAKDAASDGICCSYGGGYYTIISLSTGDTLVNNKNFISADTSHEICLGDSCSILAKATIRECSGQNNADGEIKLDVLSGNPPFTFDWSNGESTQNINGLLPGYYSVLITDDFNCIDSLYYSIGIATGVNSIAEEPEELLVFPNPSKGIIYIVGSRTTSKQLLSIYDLSGRLLISTNISESGKAEVNLTELQNGLYVGRLTSEDQKVITFKVLIKK